MELSVTDLFVVGLGFDATGAVLLAKGLLINPATIQKVASTWWGVNVGDTIDRAQNRVDAKFGIGCLVAGFMLQAVGYTLQLGGVDSDTGGGRALTAVLLMAVGVLLAYLAYWALREGELRRTLVAIAASKEEKDEHGNDLVGWTVERAKRLRDFGDAAGWEFNGAVKTAPLRAPTYSACSASSCRRSQRFIQGRRTSARLAQPAEAITAPRWRAAHSRPVSRPRLPARHWRPLRRIPLTQLSIG